MNILVINGSPKGERSNSYQLTKAFLEGIKQGINEKNKEEEVLVEEMLVNRLNIKPCLDVFPAGIKHQENAASGMIWKK